MKAARSADPVGVPEGQPALHGVSFEDWHSGGSGWSRHPRERRDFYHRTHAFPPDTTAWRKQLCSAILAKRTLFSRVPPRATTEEVRDLLDEGITYLRELARIFALLYGTPRLDHKDDPVDELVYVILAQTTSQDASQRTFGLLKERFRRWDDLLDAPRDEVTGLVYSGGTSARKTASLYGALGKLKETFGRCTLEPARNWPDDRLEALLCSLPEISRKSAYLVMMYALGRKVFPVDTYVGRCLARLGPYRELGLRLEGLDHKKLQAVLADLVPPDLRYSLHVNLVAHGRAVCRSPRPLCERCEVRNFCADFRRREVARIEGERGPTVVDLFAGGGGLSEGFKRAGFRVVLALDQDAMAMRTYWLNHPGVPEDRILVRDIRALKEGDLRRLVRRRSVDVLIGAPPCQGFSHVGHRSARTRKAYREVADRRNFLFEYMVSAALELRPRLFLMENVPGMHTARHENLSFIETAARMLEKKGNFRTAIWRLNAAAFGVPQDRVRYFLVASRLRTVPSRPPEEYRDLLRQDFDVDALPPVTLDEAIFDLPPRDAGEGQGIDRQEPRDPSSDPRYRRYLGKFRLVRGSPLLFNHTVRHHNRRDLELYALLRPGEDSVHALEQGRRDLMRYRSDAFDDKYLRLRADRPCKTIVAHLAKDGNGYIHPLQVRSITLREAARVQSFHDGYVFCGSPTDQWIQLGNAVPPVLAGVIAASFRRELERGGGG